MNTSRCDDEHGLALLVITYSYLPAAEVGSLRIARLCRYLPEFGIRPIVLTVPPTHYRHLDHSYPPLPDVHVERVGVPATPMELYRRLRNGGRSVVGEEAMPLRPSPPPSKTKQSLIRHTHALLEIPDPFWTWYLPAFHTASRLLRTTPIAAVFSSVPPYTAHLVARSLKKRFEVPWLADFRDPWTHNLRSGTFPSWRRRIDEQLESSCLSWADRVICNTDRLRATLRQVHPQISADKLVTLTNGFDDPLAAASPSTSAQKGRRLMLHLGSLEGGRRIDTFCQAVAMLIEQGKLDPSTIKVLCVGDTDLSIVRAAQAAVPTLLEQNWIEFRTRINWQAADKLRWDADVLLVFFEDSLAVPAKFYEYLPTGIPILAVTPQGALTDVLEETRVGVWAAPDDPAEIASKLLEALARPRRSAEEARLRWSSRFHFRSLARTIASWIKDLASERAEAKKTWP